MGKLAGEFLYDSEEKSVFHPRMSHRRTCPKCGNDDQRYFREVEVVDDNDEPIEDAWMCLDCGCITMANEALV